MGLRQQLQWSAHELELAAFRRTHPLRYLFLEVTRRCNLACRYCGSTCTGASQGDELSMPEWLDLIRQVAADFDPAEVMIAVTGGEPLLKEGVFELFAELQRLGFPYGMVCNGQLLDAEAARRLVHSGMGSISLSLDAPPEINDRLRGRGASEKVIAAIGHLQNAGFRGKLEVISTITAPAIEHLPAMRRLLAELRVPLWRVVPVMPIGRAASNPELVPNAEQLHGLLEFVLQARADRRLPVPEFSEEGFLGKRYEGQVRTKLWHCLAGTTIAGIRSDGRIGACPELGDAFIQGDARRERFKDVWENRYQVFRDRDWTRKGSCESCEEFRRCQGGSLHLVAAPGEEPLRCLYRDAVEPFSKPHGN